MKAIVFILLIISYGYSVVATAKATSPRYLKTVIEKSSLMQIVNKSHLRQTLRPQTSAPTSQEYISQHNVVPNNDQTQLTPQQQAEYGQRIKGLLEDWAEQYYPEFTEEEVIAILSEDSELRAKVMAVVMLGSDMIDLLDGAGLATVIMALDGDIEYMELNTRINQLELVVMQSNYSDSEPRFGIGRQAFVVSENRAYPITYRNARSYLNRVNRVRHFQISDNEVNVLRALGYTDSELIDKISPQLAQVLVNDQVQPELDNSLLNLPASVTIDLLTEPGIIGNYVLTPYQLEAFDDTIEYLANELEVDADSLEHLDAKLAMTDEDNWLHKVAELLDNPESPATLFQVTELRRLGFSFDEIGVLNYFAREAIIVSGYENREIFVKNHGKPSSKINSFVNKSGPLVYRLLRLGYEADQINKHTLPDLAKIERESQQIQLWQVILSPSVVQPDNEVSED